MYWATVSNISTFGVTMAKHYQGWRIAPSNWITANGTWPCHKKADVSEYTGCMKAVSWSGASRPTYAKWWDEADVWLRDTSGHSAEQSWAIDKQGQPLHVRALREASGKRKLKLYVRNVSARNNATADCRQLRIRSGNCLHHEWLWPGATSWTIPWIPRSDICWKIGCRQREAFVTMMSNDWPHVGIWREMRIFELFRCKFKHHFHLCSKAIKTKAIVVKYRTRCSQHNDNECDWWRRMILTNCHTTSWQTKRKLAL